MDVIEATVRRSARRRSWADDRELHLAVNGRHVRHLFAGHGELAGLPAVVLPPSGHLLGEPLAELTLNGRAAVLICPVCGDLGCGAVLARMELEEGTVRWWDFAFGASAQPQLTQLLAGELRFRRAAYEDALDVAADQAHLLGEPRPPAGVRFWHPTGRGGH